MSNSSNAAADPLAQACQWLAEARAVAVLTGAGISAESGIPTFRGPGGLWRNFHGEDLATPAAFARDPLLVWEWYDWRRSLVAAAAPNAGHLALAAFEAAHPAFTLITQNVDGLHDRAGSRRLLKLHGDLWQLRCTACPASWADRQTPLPSLPPACPECGTLARPAVVWFGESLAPGIFETAAETAARCDLFLVIGTSAVVYPAASLVPLARQSGARVIEVNLEPTPATGTAHLSLRGPAAELLPLLLLPR